MMLEQVQLRLGYLESVGLGYLTLDRTIRTLSGGEARRVALTSALGSSLVNMLYVLDEPSIGLHPRDVDRPRGIDPQAPRSGQHGGGRRARRGDDPRGRPRDRDRARGGRAGRPRRFPGHAGRDGGRRPTASPAITWPAAAAARARARGGSPIMAGSAWPARGATT